MRVIIGFYTFSPLLDIIYIPRTNNKMADTRSGILFTRHTDINIAVWFYLFTSRPLYNVPVRRICSISKSFIAL